MNIKSPSKKTVKQKKSKKRMPSHGLGISRKNHIIQKAFDNCHVVGHICFTKNIPNID